MPHSGIRWGRSLFDTKMTIITMDLLQAVITVNRNEFGLFYSNNISKKINFTTVMELISLHFTTLRL